MSKRKGKVCVLMCVCLYAEGHGAHLHPVVSSVALWIQELFLLCLSSPRLVPGKECWPWPEYLYLGSSSQLGIEILMASNFLFHMFEFRFSG